MTDEDGARHALAKHIGLQFYECDRIVPGERFGIAPMASGNYWIDQRVSDIAWWAVAIRMAGLSIFDHAWLARYDDKTNETWALVTEPYIEPGEANKLAIRATQEMAGWEICVRALPAKMGSWNPTGGCVPIVATFTRGHADWFIRKACLWALRGPLR